MSFTTLDLGNRPVPIIPRDPRLVILESPYSGNTARNVRYARAALRDSLRRGEAPIASHLLYTQPGVLDDNDPAERAQGIVAGLAWRHVAARSVFYLDLGWSQGMREAADLARREARPVEHRYIPEWEYLR